MPNLPVVAGSEVQTPTSAVKMDTSAFRESALAPGRMAAAIGQDVGSVFGDLAAKIQQNRNAKMVFDADLSMRKTKDDFTAKLQTMPDEGTWLPAWQENVDQVRQAVLDDPKAGPEVRRMLSQKFDVWQAATTAEIRTAALAKGVTDSRNSAIADSTYAARQGDIEGANNALQAAVENHAMSTAEANKIGSRFPSIAAQAQADMIISSNPIKAPDLIEQYKGVIEPPVFVKLQANARAARNAAQSSNLDGILQEMDAGDGTVAPELLKEKVKAGEITQRGADSIINRMKQADIKTAREDHSIAMMLAHDHDWVNDPKPEETANRMREEGAALPPAMRRTLYEEITNKLNTAKKAGVAEMRPVERAIFDRMKEDREDNGVFIPVREEAVPAKEHYFKANEPAKTLVHHVPGGLKILQNPEKFTDAQIAENFGKGVKRDDLLKAEQLQYAKQVQKMRDWFKANPDAKEDEAETYRQTLAKPMVMAAVAQSLAPKAGPTIATGKRVRQSGVVYEFNGNGWDEVK